MICIFTRNGLSLLKIRQTMEFSLRQLADMPACLVSDILGKGNPRWIELVEQAPEEKEGFRRWLEDGGRERTADNAAVYFRRMREEREDSACILAETAELARRTDAETESFLFMEGARRKLEQYRGKPLKDTLEYGDYIGMAADAALDIHKIGMIRGIQYGTDGKPLSYTVEKLDGSVEAVGVDMVNRIY